MKSENGEPSGIELEAFGERTTGTGDSSAASLVVAENHVTQALPPVDRGRDAWLFLAAAFTIETLVWGLPFSVVRSPQSWPRGIHLNTAHLGCVASVLVNGLIRSARSWRLENACFGGYPPGEFVHIRDTILRLIFTRQG